LTQVPDLLATVGRRDIHDEAIHIHDVNVHGFAKQAAQRGLEPEFANFEQWLNAGLPWVRICRPENLQALSLDVQPIRDPNVEVSKFHPALEASRERLNDAGTQNGLRSRNHQANTDDRSGNKNQEEAGDPTPSAALSS